MRLLTEPGPIQQIPPGTRVAVDTEFHGERRYWPQLHLIQLRAEGGPIHLVDAHDRAMMRSIAEPLRACTWILHAGQQDLPLLEQALGGVAAVVHDTQIAAGLVSTTYPAGLARLLQSELGIVIEKGEALSDWSRRPLAPAQLNYAADDVRHLHDLWDGLANKAAALDRTDALDAACTEARRDSLAGPDPELAWRRIPGRASLEGPALPVLQELGSWRERLAQEQDQPPGAVLSNRLLLDLAKRRPISAHRLVAGRRTPKGPLQKHATELLERIGRASRRPEWGWPQSLRPDLIQARLHWWRALGAQLSLANEWAPRLVLPEIVLESLALGQTPEEVLLDWRGPFLGDLLAEARSPAFGIRYPAPRDRPGAKIISAS